MESDVFYIAIKTVAKIIVFCNCSALVLTTEFTDTCELNLSYF